MAPTKDDAVFLDTNVLVYASLKGSPFSTAARTRLTELEDTGSSLWISRQVLREFLAVTTRPGTIAPEPTVLELLQSVRQFESSFLIADEDSAVTTCLIDLIQSRVIRGKQVHDANIVATMLRHGVQWLLTHNTGDFIRYKQEIKILPLLDQIHPA
jgi:predicted nucleic acid-binding protein